MDPVSYIREEMGPLSPLPTGAEPRLGRLQGVKAIVFDIYGTLLISGAGDVSLSEEVDSIAAMEKALSAIESKIRCCDARIWLSVYKDSIAKRQEMRRAEGIEFPEVEIREVWADLFSDLGPESWKQEELETIARRYEYAINPCWEMPGAGKVVSGLQERNYPLGILSNSQFYTHELVEALIGVPLLPPVWKEELTLYSYREREGKPSLALYEKIQQNAIALGMEPEEILYIGNDFCKDIEPAQKVGFRAALFAGDQRSFRPGPQGTTAACAKADAVLTDLSQLGMLV